MSDQSLLRSFRAAVLVLKRKIRREPPSLTTWPRGQLPDQAYLVGDGFGTRSTPDGSYTPWFREIAPRLRQIEPSATIRAFSYSSPGWHYFEPHTSVPLQRAVDALFPPYAPRLGLPITYIAFSFAGPLFSLGLSAWQQRQASGTVRPGLNALILVQPALRLTSTAIDVIVAEFAGEDGDGVPELLADFIDHDSMQPADHTLRRVVTALEPIAAQVPVWMLYWPGDRFIHYDDALVTALEMAGVQTRRFDILEFPAKLTDPFRQHAAVAVHDEVLQAIEDLLRQLLQQRQPSEG